MRQLLFSMFFMLLAAGLPAQLLVPYRAGELLGYADLDGNIKIEPRYSEANFFNSKGYAVVYEGDKGYIIDTLGNPVKHFPGMPGGQWAFKQVIGLKSNYFRVKAEDFNIIIDDEFNAAFQTEFSIGDISAGFEYAKVTDYRDPKHKQYGVIGRDGRFILPMSEHKVAVLDMKGEAATTIFTLYKDGKVLAYDTKGRPLADFGYQKMKYVAVGEEKAYLLKRDGLTDIVSEDIQLIYSDLDVGVAADPEQFARLKKATGFSAAMIAGILNTNEELKCFAYEEAGCLCRVARPETGDYSIYRNGASLLKQDETIYNFNSEKGFLVFQNKDNKTGAKNRLGEVVIPPGNDTFGNSFLFNAIVVKRGDRYFFYDADGKQTDEDGYAFYDNYRLKRSEDGGYAFHNKDGVPLTGFEFEEIVRVVHAGCFLGVKASGYSLLSPEGEELLFLECDTITDILKNRVFLEYRKGGKTGILHKDGQAIIPALYDTISLTHQYSGITFFSARKANGAIDIYNPEGKIFPIDDARKPGLRVTPSSDGYFSIYNPETGETEFYNPEMELIISIKIGSQSHSSNLAEYGIFKIDDYYFNYRNGVSFKSD